MASFGWDDSHMNVLAPTAALTPVKARAAYHQHLELAK